MEVRYPILAAGKILHNYEQYDVLCFRPFASGHG
jgi:hypothetical protein